MRPCLRTQSRLRLFPHKTSTRQDGVILLDGLLALLILTVGVAALTTVAVHALRDSRAAARTTHALRLLHDGAEHHRLDPTGTWAAQWQTEVATALPAGSGIRTAHQVTIEWRDPAGDAVRRIALPLTP